MIVIGEKINATRKSIARAIASRDEEAVAILIRQQEEAGADVLDLNAGAGQEDLSRAVEDMQWLVGVAQKATAKPLAMDSEIPEVLEAALSVVTGPTAWINSVSAEKRRMESVLPLAKKFASPLVALCMDDHGIPGDLAGRMRAAEILYRAADENGIPFENLYFDPLVMPLGAQSDAGALALSCIRSIKENLVGSKTVLGLSNVSFGLPMRPALNQAFLILCMGAGLDAAILDPCDETLMTGLLAAEALMGKDAHCGRFIRAYRKQMKKGGKP
ncbi:MAG: dihydropteroate synthase [Proteobacteria bacterium]|nr:dihydropteroate synthase [Pseudomonadota bacterium]